MFIIDDWNISWRQGVQIRHELSSGAQSVKIKIPYCTETSNGEGAWEKKCVSRDTMIKRRSSSRTVPAWDNDHRSG